MTLGLLLAGLTASSAQEWRTTSSLIGESKYGENFEHYHYVNPEAPKGGTLNATATGTFDSFNPFTVRGTPAAGLGQFGGMLYDTLMQQATDEPGTSHPLIAEAYTHPDDYSSATYRINPQARWHDGAPITAEDVVWSFNILKQINPLYGRYYHNVTEAVALSEREVEFRFDEKGNRELPHIMGDLAVLPKHWWESTDKSGKQRDIAQPTLEPPLGSGPYKIERFRPGSEVVWTRVEDYWGAELPVNIGRNNFERRKYTYFTDENAGWQAFTKGGIADFRMENRAQRWATEYNFPAFEAGDVIKQEFETESGEPMQGYFINMRRAKFQDRRVRQALTYAFDFESMNRTLFYGLYTRTKSYFEGSELASSGRPEGLELEILKTVEDDVPQEVFTEEFKLPVFDTAQAARENLRRAFELFNEAGWSSRDGRLVNDNGEQFRIELLGYQATHERVALPYISNLRRLGIDATIRIIDATQYQNRLNDFDYDVLAIHSVQQSQSPGNEQREYWGSAAADMAGSRNYSGIKNEAIDQLVERVIFAKDREELVAATNALDRVLLWNFYVVPQWHLPQVWVAYWNKFGMPDQQPAYLGVDIDSWWIDPEREAALAAKYRGTN
jgi:microcin C transport system substrate-binding protein